MDILGIKAPVRVGVVVWQRRGSCASMTQVLLLGRIPKLACLAFQDTLLMKLDEDQIDMATTTDEEVGSNRAATSG